MCRGDTVGPERFPLGCSPRSDACPEAPPDRIGCLPRRRGGLRARAAGITRRRHPRQRLRQRAAVKVHKNVGLYAVRYPADTEVDIGANDMSAHVQSTINGCPETRIVLGGYSLGAAVTDVVMAAPVAIFGFTNPLPPGADQHIAAVALFGNGTTLGRADRELQPVYRRSDDRPVPRRRPICNPADPHTWQNNWSQHMAAGLHRFGHGESGRRLRRRQAVIQSRVRMSRVINVRACNSLSGG